MAISYAVIGRSIKAARNRANMTQAQVAEQMNMSTLNYGRLERAERRVSLEQLSRIAGILNVPMDTLCSGMGFEADLHALNDNTLGEAIERIAAGCTQDARRLMLSVCELIAAYEKRNPDGV